VIAEPITDPSLVVHGETPTYDQRTGQLHWVDMEAGDLMTMDGAGAIDRLHVDRIAACWRPRVNGGAVIGTEHGYAFIGADSSVEVHSIFTDPALRMNDGSCDPQGRYYCGSMAYDETPGAGTLYRLDVDGTVSVALTATTISNGMVWSLDGTQVYYIDTPTRRVDVFDFDAAAGTLHDRRPVVTIDPAVGHPDGMTIDAEGGLWVALWDGRAVHRYDPDGTLTEVIEVAASQTTACAFGGADLDELYITTSRRDIDPSAEPLAGALFRVRPGVSGVPVLMYGG
jgi:sugar lactone lactonase YvrE